MLNYIWISLIVIGILVAAGSDWHDSATNRYHNGAEIHIDFQAVHPTSIAGEDSSLKEPCLILVTPAEFQQAYSIAIPDTIREKAVLVTLRTGESAFHIFLDRESPELWKDIARNLGSSDSLIATARDVTPAHAGGGSGEGSAIITFAPVRFVKLNAVTNDGVIAYAKLAVELAIGLIGIMALWLGVMKIAEQAGLVAKLAALLKPVTTRLFPDVPPDHPAMGAMILNISANMLGLANAATPLGLKAMEELNKLNPKAGTATDAMCTFLVINTSNVQLIPATVIAIRAAAGSSNPTEIIGPVILATGASLIVGVAIVKLLSKLPIYRRQLGAAQ
jgi:spore maturation protein A